MPSYTISSEAYGLVSRLCSFCFPGAENGSRVRAIKTTQQGEIRSTPEARWMPFTADEVIEATRSRFRWEAHLRETTFIDEYENGHGLSGVKPTLASPVRKVSGPDIDQAELQRYLASIPVCPSILLNHPFLELTALDTSTLRARDRKDPTAATIDLDINHEGRPTVCRANRARMIGKQTALTPWSVAYVGFREWEGVQVANRMEVSWRLSAGEFPYFRGEVTSLEILG